MLKYLCSSSKPSKSTANIACPFFVMFCFDIYNNIKINIPHRSRGTVKVTTTPLNPFFPTFCLAVQKRRAHKGYSHLNTMASFQPRRGIPAEAHWPSVAGGHRNCSGLERCHQAAQVMKALHYAHHPGKSVTYRHPLSDPNVQTAS